MTISVDEPCYEWETDNLKNKLPEDAYVFVVSVGDTSAVVPMGYYLCPMRLFGSGLDYVDYSRMTDEEFLRKMSDKEYIYIRSLEDEEISFVDKYSDCFENSANLYSGVILKIDSVDKVIRCHVVDEISLGED